MEYFRYLPKIEYSDNITINITARAILKEQIRTNIDIYLPYLLSDHERPDTLAEAYYGNANWSWLIFYANDIIDPIRDWFKNETEFNIYLDRKYQTATDVRPGFEIANNRIHHYENENGLQVDFLTFINDVADTVNSANTFPSTGYHINDILIMVDSEGNETKAKILKVNEYGYILNFIPIYDDSIHGVYRVNTGAKKIVTCLDYEEELNESKRRINLIHEAYAATIVEQFKNIFENTGGI